MSNVNCFYVLISILVLSNNICQMFQLDQEAAKTERPDINSQRLCQEGRPIRCGLGPREKSVPAVTSFVVEVVSTFTAPGLHHRKPFRELNVWTPLRPLIFKQRADAQVTFAQQGRSCMVTVHLFLLLQYIAISQIIHPFTALGMVAFELLTSRDD